MLEQLIRERHSSRVPFDRNRPISEEELAHLLEAARWTPTAHNMQNFELIVVDDPRLIDQLGAIPTDFTLEFIRENFPQLSFSDEELRRKKVGILGTLFPPSWRSAEPDPEAIRRESRRSLHDAIQDSPMLLVVTYDPRRRAPSSPGDFLGIMSLGCLLENLWLMAEWLGLGFQVMSTFGGERVAPRVKELLAIPAELQLAFAVRLGHPLRVPPPPRVRRDLADFVHHNRHGSR